jgi:hypothetical protein
LIFVASLVITRSIKEIEQGLVLSGQIRESEAIIKLLNFLA